MICMRTRTRPQGAMHASIWKEFHYLPVRQLTGAGPAHVASFSEQKVADPWILFVLAHTGKWSREYHSERHHQCSLLQGLPRSPCLRHAVRHDW